MPDETFTAHDVPDLINCLPVLFGFTPEESVVAIATHGPRRRLGFRMRMDLPPVRQLEQAAEVVVSHLGHQGADGAIVVAVTEHTGVAELVVREIERRLGAIEPVMGVWADGSRYWTTDDWCDPAGFPYEASGHHPAVVRAVLEGQEILPNRAALAAKLEPDGGERRAWLNHASDIVAAQVVASINTRGDETVAETALSDLAPALAAAHAGRTLTDEQSLLLAHWAAVLPARDALGSLITPASARTMVGLWSHVARTAPACVCPPALSLAGFASWLTGDGAFALIASERALDLDPEYTLAGLLLRMLECGVPPSAWRPFDAGEHASA
jgi:hypothetical protein